MEAVESGGKGTIRLVNIQGSDNPAWIRVKWISDPDTDYLITEWTLYINVARFEERNDDGTYRYDIETKRNIIAHEIGHVFGLGHAEDTGQIMYESFKINEETGKIKSGMEEITLHDIQGMEVVTENFETIMAADDEYCSQIYTPCGGYIFKKHPWTDETDAICDDCGYIRPMPIEVLENGLLGVNIDEQEIEINYSEPGTEHEWSQWPPKFSELHGYRDSCAGLSWVDVGDLFGGETHRYCLNGYYFGRWSNSPFKFDNLRDMTKIYRKEGGYYMLTLIDPDPWLNQYHETTRSLTGIFWAPLFGNEVDGYYIQIWRGLADTIDDSIIRAGGPIWSPPLHIPVYYSPGLGPYEFLYFNMIATEEGIIATSSQIIKKVFIDGFNDQVKFTLEWMGSDLDLTLKRPDGTIIDPPEAQTDPDIEYVESDTYEFYLIQDPMAGEWEAIIDAVDVMGEEPFTLTVIGNSPGVSFDVYTDKDQYTYPENILVQSDVVAVDYVAGAEVTGTVERPDGSTVDITLFDNGLESHGDETSDDGIYSNYFSEYTEDGIYTFDMTVENIDGVQALPDEPPAEPIDPFMREASISVTVSGIPQQSTTELALDFPSSIQYSDMLSGKATLNSEGTSLEGKEVEFSYMLPTEALITDENGEVSSTSYIVEEAPITESYTICANFYGDSDYLSSCAEGYITVERENANLAYTGDTLVQVGTSTTLSCLVTQEDDGWPGDIANAGEVIFNVTTEEGFSETYTAPVDQDGIVAIQVDLPVGLYRIVASIESEYYTADPTSDAICAVYDPQGSFATGGGWFVPEDSSEKVNFGFEVKYKNDGTLKGNLEMIDHNTATDYKEIDFTYMVVVGSKAYLKGNIMIDGEGSYPFTTIVEDNGSLGKDSDKLSIDVLVDGDHIVFDEIIDSGNIVIHK